MSDRQNQIDAMRRVLEFLESAPEFPLPSVMDKGASLYSFVNSKIDMARAVRLLGSGKKSADSDWFNFQRDFGGIQLQATASREQVCERVVVGIDEVVSEEPDPVAVAALPRVTVRRQIEKIEWRCPDNLLGASE